MDGPSLIPVREHTKGQHNLKMDRQAWSILFTQGSPIGPQRAPFCWGLRPQTPQRRPSASKKSAFGLHGSPSGPDWAQTSLFTMLGLFGAPSKMGPFGALLGTPVWKILSRLVHLPLRRKCKQMWEYYLKSMVLTVPQLPRTQNEPPKVTPNATQKQDPKQIQIGNLQGIQRDPI